MPVIFRKLPTLCAVLTLAIAAVQPLYSQFTSGPTAPPPAPVSQAFTDGFMDGRRAMALNLGSGKFSSSAKANTGKTELEETSKELKDLAAFVDANWDKADDAGRGKVAGEVEVAVMSDQINTQELSVNVGVDIPNHMTEGGYFSAPGKLNGDKAHAMKLLTDTADQLDAINIVIAADRKVSKTGEFIDNHAIVDVLPGGAILRTGRRSSATKNGAPIRSNNFMIDSIRVTTANLAHILNPASAQ